MKATFNDICLIIFLLFTIITIAILSQGMFLFIINLLFDANIQYTIINILKMFIVYFIITLYNRVNFK